MAQLYMRNDKVRDQDDPDRCPQCGKPLLRIEDRGDAVAYIHVGHGPQRECLV